MIVCVPSGITDVEKRAVEEAVVQAGAKADVLIEEPMAAAIGAGMPVDKPLGNMVVDIGGGTTEVAIISLNGIVISKSIRLAGNAIDNAIVNFIKKEYSMTIGERTAEEIKFEIGSAMQYTGEGYYDVKGRDMVTGLPKNVRVSSSEIRDAMAEVISEIVEVIKMALEETPPELAGDIIERDHPYRRRRTDSEYGPAGFQCDRNSSVSFGQSAGLCGGWNRKSAGEHTSDVPFYGQTKKITAGCVKWCV